LGWTGSISHASGLRPPGLLACMRGIGDAHSLPGDGPEQRQYLVVEQCSYRAGVGESGDPRGGERVVVAVVMKQVEWREGRGGTYDRGGSRTAPQRRQRCIAPRGNSSTPPSSRRMRAPTSRHLCPFTAQRRAPKTSSPASAT